MARVKKVKSPSDMLTQAQQRALKLMVDSPTGEMNIPQRVYYHIRAATLNKLVKLGLVTWVSSRSSWKPTAKGKDVSNDIPSAS